MSNEVAFEDADGFYVALSKEIDAAPDDAQAIAFLSRLTLVLASVIGAQDRLLDSIRRARNAPCSREFMVEDI